MKLPFQHYKNDEVEEEEKHDNRGTEDEESSGVYNVLSYLIVVNASYRHSCVVLSTQKFFF